MKSAGNNSGFSLVELLIVCVILGIVAAMAIPAYQRGVRAAENSAVFAVLRSISSTQVQYYTSNSRFGTLPEVQAIMANGIGTTTGDRVVRGTYVFEMTPVSPTPTDLRTGYTISAVRSLAGDATYRYELNQSGKITRILPPGAEE